MPPGHRPRLFRHREAEARGFARGLGKVQGIPLVSDVMQALTPRACETSGWVGVARTRPKLPPFENNNTKKFCDRGLAAFFFLILVWAAFSFLVSFTPFALKVVSHLPEPLTAHLRELAFRCDPFMQSIVISLRYIFPPPHT